MADMGQKRSILKTFSHNPLLVTSVNKRVQNGSDKTQTIKNEKFSQFLCKKLQLTFGAFFFKINTRLIEHYFFIKYSNTKVSKSHKQNVDSF